MDVSKVEQRSYIKISFVWQKCLWMSCWATRSIGWKGIALSYCCTLNVGIQTWTHSNCWPAAKWTSSVCSHRGASDCYWTVFNRWTALDCGGIICAFWYFCIDSVLHFKNSSSRYGFYDALACQVISIAFYIEGEKSNIFCSEALILAWGSFTYNKSMTRNPRLYFPSEVIRTQGFYALKKSINPDQDWTRKPRIQWRVW